MMANIDANGKLNFKEIHREQETVSEKSILWAYKMKVTFCGQIMANRRCTKVRCILDAPPHLRLALWNQKGIDQIRDLAIL
jgi:hypothetical protein